MLKHMYRTYIFKPEGSRSLAQTKRVRIILTGVSLIRTHTPSLPRSPIQAINESTLDPVWIKYSKQSVSCLASLTMAGILDSKAYFTGRLAALNLNEFTDKFVEREWTTMSAFAFSVNYVPGRSDEAVMVEKVYKRILGSVDHPREHAVRRLFFEAHTMASHDITRRLSHPEEEGKAPRKLPLEERGERWRAIKMELPNLNLRGELEPSNALVDKFVEMEELNQLRYIKWEEYTKRDQESKGIKKIPLWAEERGQLCRVYKDEELIHQPQDRLELKYALQRRGLAMQMAHLLSFKSHEKLIDYYFEEMARDSVDLSRYDRISLDQVMNTDKEIFVRIGEETREGFKALGNLPAKEYPLDKLLEQIMVHPRVVHLLLPLPLSNGSSKKQEPHVDKKRDQSEASQVQRLMNEIKKMKSSKGEGKGAGKGGGSKVAKGANRNKRAGGAAMPKELIGMTPEVNGKRVCYSYNMPRGCDVSGEDKCTRGYHLCCFPGCGEEHSLQKCGRYAKATLKKKNL